MDLRNFDLNLLVVLHTLLSEQSVSKTAKRLNLSQPATSAALSRLRATLNDPLLVRDGLRMVPTSRAEQLRQPLQTILAEIEQTLATPKPFDPSTVNRTFRIATNDYGAFLLIPHLINRWQAIAPGIDIEIWDIPQHLESALQQGEIDLAVADAWSLRHCRCTETLFPETFTCLVRHHHPRIQNQLTLDQYLQEHHALVSPQGRVPGNVDIALAKQNLQRHVRVTAPHFLAIPGIIASTDLIVTIATRIAEVFAKNYALKTFPPPIALDGFEIAMVWQNRMSNDRASQWLRHEFAAIGQIIMSEIRA